MSWIPLLAFPVEWAALALLVVACLYWERSGFSGLGVEGCLASAVVGLLVGYQATGNYPLACLIAAGCATLFGLLSGTLVHLLRADPAIGALGISLAPVCAVGLLSRASDGLHMLTESPPPGLFHGTIFDGTYAEDLVCNPWLLAAPFIVALAAWILWQTPYGLRLRAFGENPAWRVLGSRPSAYRLSALAIGALWTVPAAALLVRAHPEAPPIGLGFLALACTIAGRWTLVGGVALAAGPALLRTLRPYASSSPLATAALDAAPFLLALV
ncbi:MAG: ABC transporter permease subunit, partial [Candidatus Eiseniibacteriota bacterium]